MYRKGEIEESNVKGGENKDKKENQLEETERAKSKPLIVEGARWGSAEKETQQQCYHGATETSSG